MVATGHYNTYIGEGRAEDDWTPGGTSKIKDEPVGYFGADADFKYRAAPTRFNFRVVYTRETRTRKKAFENSLHSALPLADRRRELAGRTGILKKDQDYCFS